MSIKMVNSKQLRVSSNRDSIAMYLCFNLICFVICIHDNMTIIHIYCDNMTIIHHLSDQIKTFDSILTTRQLLTVEITSDFVGTPLHVSANFLFFSEVLVAIHETNIHMIFIAPAYSRVRYRSLFVRPFGRSFVRSSVRPSVNIYVEVWFSRHQR